MGNDPSWNRRDLKPRERKAELRRFSPADAAFVAHLTGCDRCRRHAARFLVGEEAASSGGLAMLSSLERGLISHLAAGGGLRDQADDEPQADLPLAELQKFVSALSPEQAAFIGHLIGCERCLHAVAKTLKPPTTTPPRDLVIVI
jgi:hypothetical protein